MKKTDLAYVAGIIDGEGCIGIYTGRNGNSPVRKKSFVLQVSVASTDEWLPTWLKFAFGGSVCLYPPKKPQHSPAWRWYIAARKASQFLQLVFPYLRLKRYQAEIAIKFQSAKRNWGQGKAEKHWVLEEAQAILLKRAKPTNQNMTKLMEGE